MEHSILIVIPGFHLLIQEFDIRKRWISNSCNKAIVKHEELIQMWDQK